MIDALNEGDAKKAAFGEYEEEAIVSLVLEHPEFFTHIIKYLEPGLFKRTEVMLVMAHVLDYYNKHGVLPTRGMVHDIATKELTVDDAYADDIVKIINRKSVVRDIPAIKQRLLEWTRHRAYELLYSKESIEQFSKGNYGHIEEIFEKARSIKEGTGQTMKFWDQLESLFIEDNTQKFTTGIPELDSYIKPARKEMLVWMAPTGVGKSIMLVNNCINNSRQGHKVLYVTLELSILKTALRSLGVLSGHPVDNPTKYIADKEELIKLAQKIRKNGAGDIIIQEFPADSVSIDSISTFIDDLRRSEGWVPDVVVIDYLELLLSNRSADNNDSYTRQKAVSTQVRGFAMSQNVCVFTATQTNRGGNSTESAEKGIDVTNIAESYGKAMPMDYLVSINQTKDEYDAASETKIADARLYIAKNRNGEKNKTVPVKINYRTFAIKPKQ